MPRRTQLKYRSRGKGKKRPRGERQIETAKVIREAERRAA